MDHIRSMASRKKNPRASSTQAKPNNNELKENKLIPSLDMFLTKTDNFFRNSNKTIINKLQIKEDKLKNGETTSYNGIDMHTSPNNICLQVFADSLKEIEPEHLKNISMYFNKQTKELNITLLEPVSGDPKNIFHTDVESLGNRYQNQFDKIIQIANDREQLNAQHEKNQQEMLVDYERKQNMYITYDRFIYSLSSEASPELPERTILAGQDNHKKLRTVNQILDKRFPIDTHGAQRLQLECMLFQAGHANMLAELMEQNKDKLEFFQPIQGQHKETQNLRETRIYVIANNSFFIDIASRHNAIETGDDPENVKSSMGHCVVENRAQFLSTNDSFDVVGNQSTIIWKP